MHSNQLMLSMLTYANIVHIFHLHSKMFSFLRLRINVSINKNAPTILLHSRLMKICLHASVNMFELPL